ncbi:MAG TPA: glycoside hydrolase family 15 protein [Stellaceae bacterium]|nr:glycoside hydrolase family 15 protein [Stellaceae bacterium]
MAMRIEDYGLIGDTLTAALVARDGSIDWLCLPRLDSPALFAALLGDSQNGRWIIAPVGQVRRSVRRYRPDTLILETEIETDTGRALLIDFMPPPADPSPAKLSGENHPGENHLGADHRRADLVRLVVGLAGTVDFETRITLRFDYGRVVPWVRRLNHHGFTAVAGPDAVVLWSSVALHGRNFETEGRFTVAAGETMPFSLTWHPSHLTAPPPADPAALLGETEAWWRKWCAQATIGGPYRDIVMRSLITLKALTYSPTGGIAAAATSSLPEAIGGVRNWDYRYCWLRDATLTLWALIRSGFHDEGRAWRSWLLRSAAGQPQQLQIMYGLAGERRLTELELPWLSGYEDSKPVRIGNGAYEQVQLDVYGEVISALHLGHEIEGHRRDDTWRLQKVLLKFVERIWRSPDAGMWEIRGPLRHFTYSKVMCWVGFDRAIDAVERFGFSGPVDHWRKIRAEIRDDILARGWSETRQSFVQSYESDALDASLLLLPMTGFLPADDPRVVSTIAAIQRELTAGGLIMRYATETGVDGLPPGEGVFLACSFWLVEDLAAIGRRDEAVDLFDKLVALANDLGLLAEEYSPQAKRQVGNFPQAFSHVALINAALSLGELG